MNDENLNHTKKINLFIVQFGLHPELSEHVLHVSSYGSDSKSITILFKDDSLNVVRKALRDMNRTIFDIGLIYLDAEGNILNKALFSKAIINDIEFDSLTNDSEDCQDCNICVGFGIETVNYCC